VTPRIIACRSSSLVFAPPMDSLFSSLVHVFFCKRNRRAWQTRCRHWCLQL